jgi:hypothetical protein
MKTKTLNCTVITLIPIISLALTGCGTPPVNPLATQQLPSLAGGRVVIQTSHEQAEVTEVLPDQGNLALRSSEGATIRCKAAPQVVNLGQIQVGEIVKATLSEAVAIYLVKDGPPPNAGEGVTLTGPVEAEPRRSVVLMTTDSHAKVYNVDRSYRLLRLEYPDGSRKEYKVALPDTLENIEKGDEAVVRTTEPLAICLKAK